MTMAPYNQQDAGTTVGLYEITRDSSVVHTVNLDVILGSMGVINSEML